MRVRQRLLIPAVGVAVSFVAACGSTVQLHGQVTVGAGGSGLAPSGAAAGAAGGGSSQGSGATGVTGAGGALTGGTTGGATGTTAAGGAARTTGGAAATGVGGPSATLANHDPIQIGFVTTSVGNAAAFGVNAGQSYTDQQMYDAVIAEYNAAGGVDGHKIVPVYGATDTASSNWANDFSAVCSKFTQDNHVKAVIGYVFVFLPSFESCLAKAGVAHLYGGYQPGDAVDQQQYPSLVSTAHPSVDAADLAPVEGAISSGLITRSTKVGILNDTCSDGDRAYSRTLQPWLTAHGVNFQTITMSCARGASDVSGAASAVSSAELRFASSGVTVVYAGGVALLLFMEDAQSQSYTPEYVTSVGGAGLEANAPASQMAHLHGFGWMPAVDVDQSNQPYAPTPGQQACAAMLVKHGLHPSAYNDFMAAFQACDGLNLYAKALAATGSTAPTGIVRAVLAALPGYQADGTYNGGLEATSLQRGGPAVYREYQWVSACSCLRYTGPVMTIQGQ